MASHGELARTRPPARYLTGFYVALSFGGMIGGLVAGLVAPFTFSWVAEYPIQLALAAMCRPPETSRGRSSAWIWLSVVVAAIILIGFSFSSGKITEHFEYYRVWIVSYVAVVAAALAILYKMSRWRLSVLVVLGLILIRVYPADDGRVETVRSFFGVHKIVVTPGGQYHVLMPGTTIHGAERMQNNDGTPITGRPDPISYYHKDGGIGRAIAAVRERKGGPIRAAVIGLGAGTLTCASQPDERWRFFEIDQAM